MPVAQSPAHNINSSKGCPSITESFPLCCLLVHTMSLSPLARHCQWHNPVAQPHWNATPKNQIGHKQVYHIRACNSSSVIRFYFRRSVHAASQSRFFNSSQLVFYCFSLVSRCTIARVDRRFRPFPKFKLGASSFRSSHR
jgi:hypothetical protein